MTSPLDAVYEKFKHLDVPLSDPEWCQSGDGAAIYAIAGELWRAVKEARGQPVEKPEPCEIEGEPCLCMGSPCQRMKDHDASIAAQATAAENKRVLDNILKKVLELMERKKQVTGFWSGGDRHLEPVKEYIESLRAQPKERDPE